jgi:hypothetical protein
VGDGFDARPFRLPWPPGTVIYVVAPPEAHERAEALLAGAPGGPPRVERGCLLRRVSLNLAAAEAAAATGPGGASGSCSGSDASSGGGGGGGGSSSSILMAQLERAGFRQDRLSLWALQGLHGLGLSRAALMELLAEVTNAAAFHSLLVGELPLAGPASDTENALAEVGLLGAAHGHDAPGAGGGHGRLGPTELAALSSSSGRSDESGSGGSSGRGRWLFAAQQMRLSLGQMGVYADHVEAAEEADEDFLGHFS